MNIEYKILKGNSLEEIEQQTIDAINEGWQGVAPVQLIQQDNKYSWIHEMVKFPMRPEDSVGMAPESEEETAKFDEQFITKYLSMDEWVKDLLSINNIALESKNGQLFTKYGNKVEPGISPQTVLNILKISKHCPVDLDEEGFMNNIQGII